jgi:hypothetical protein
MWIFGPDATSAPGRNKTWQMGPMHGSQAKLCCAPTDFSE